MKPARFFILGVALVAGGAAAFLVGPGDEKKPQAPRAKSKIGTLSLAVAGKFDASEIEGNTDRTTAYGPTALVSAPANDAS